MKVKKVKSTEIYSYIMPVRLEKNNVSPEKYNIKKYYNIFKRSFTCILQWMDIQQTLFFAKV